MIILLQLLLIWQVAPAQEAAAPPLRLARKLTEASLTPELFGEGWRPSAGIVVNDINRLEEVPADQRDVINDLQLKPPLEADGVVGVADYSFVRTKAPLNTVTVRVFVFKDVDRCDAFWRAKVLTASWEERLKPIEHKQYTAVDNIKTELPNVQKRTVKFDNVYVSAHQLGRDDLHLKALDHIIKQLTTPVEKPTETNQGPVNSEREERK